MSYQKVLIKQTCRPRAGGKLLAGEQYHVPREVAERLVRIGKAELVADTPPAKTAKGKTPAE